MEGNLDIEIDNLSSKGQHGDWSHFFLQGMCSSASQQSLSATAMKTKSLKRREGRMKLQAYGNLHMRLCMYSWKIFTKCAQEYFTSVSSDSVPCRDTPSSKP